MTKANEAKKLMSVNDLAAMTFTRETENGEKTVKLVDFVTDRQYIDVDSEVEKDYNFPCIKAIKNGKPVVKDGKEVYHPVYYVVKLAENSNTIAVTEETIDTYYTSNDNELSGITIEDETANNYNWGKTKTNVYQETDSVENVLIFTGSKTASNYKEIIKGFDSTSDISIRFLCQIQ